jgi:hypothetical protein
LGFARQKNWALDNLPFESEWILIIDADEAVSPALRDALSAISAKSANTVPEVAFHINRHFVFMRGVIRHGGYYPSWNVRVFRRGKARYEDRDVHEHMIADGPVGFINHDLIHWDRRSLEHYIAKHNRYSTLEAEAIFRQLGEEVKGLPARLLGDPLSRRRWLKRHIYPRLPCKFLIRFLYMYVLKLGFLDGITGLRFALFISSYELHIELKLAELKARVSEKQSPRS